MLSPMPRISAKPREYLDKQSLSNKRKTAVRSCCDAADALQDFAPPRSVRVHACASKISFGTEDTCVVLCADGSFEVVKPDRYAFATYTHQTTFFFFLRFSQAARFFRSCARSKAGRRFGRIASPMALQPRSHAPNAPFLADLPLFN